MASKQRKVFVGMPWDFPREKMVVKPKEEFSYVLGKSSLGRVLVASSAFGLVSVLVGKSETELVKELQERFPKIALRKDKLKLTATLARVIGFIEKPIGIFDLPLNVRGTLFQRRVWEAVQKIPLGKTSTYSEIAEMVKAPRAMRAVGSTCTNNLFFMIVPCHRVLHKGESVAAGFSRSSHRQQKLVLRELKLKKQKAVKP